MVDIIRWFIRSPAKVLLKHLQFKGGTHMRMYCYGVIATNQTVDEERYLPIIHRACARFTEFYETPLETLPLSSFNTEIHILY